MNCEAFLVAVRLTSSRRALRKALVEGFSESEGAGGSLSPENQTVLRGFGFSALAWERCDLSVSIFYFQWWVRVWLGSMLEGPSAPFLCFFFNFYRGEAINFQVCFNEFEWQRFTVRERRERKGGFHCSLRCCFFP